MSKRGEDWVCADATAQTRPATKQPKKPALKAILDITFLPKPFVALPSEIRLVCDVQFPLVQDKIAFDADLFRVGCRNAAEALPGAPGLFESVRIVDREGHFQAAVVLDDPPALDDVHLVGVRGSELVEMRAGLRCDGVDDERLSLL